MVWPECSHLGGCKGNSYLCRELEREIITVRKIHKSLFIYLEQLLAIYLEQLLAIYLEQLLAIYLEQLLAIYLEQLLAIYLEQLLARSTKTATVFLRRDQPIKITFHNIFFNVTEFHNH